MHHQKKKWSQVPKCFFPSSAKLLKLEKISLPIYNCLAWGIQMILISITCMLHHANNLKKGWSFWTNTAVAGRQLDFAFSFAQHLPPPWQKNKKNPYHVPSFNYYLFNFLPIDSGLLLLKNTVEGDCGFGDYHVFNQEFTTDKQLAHHYINLLNKNTGKVEYAHLKSLIYHTHKKAKPHSGNHIQRQKFKTRGAC